MPCLSRDWETGHFAEAWLSTFAKEHEAHQAVADRESGLGKVYGSHVDSEAVLPSEV
jgi:hypothetical protein